MTRFTYKKDIDVLTVEDGEYDRFDRSLELGGFVIDLADDGSFLGVEVIDASRKIPLTRSQLQDLDTVEVSFERDDEVLRVTLELVVDGQRNTVTSQYPRPVHA